MDILALHHRGQGVQSQITNQVAEATGRLLQPLDGRLDRSIVQDLLPAARRMGTVKDRLAGVPIGIQMEHTVYNTTIFTETPVIWTDVLSKTSPYLFPAKGVNGRVNDTTLSQYFSSGGELLDDEGLPKIDDKVLISTLEFYQAAQQNSIIDQTILEAATTEDCHARQPQYAGKSRHCPIGCHRSL